MHQKKNKNRKLQIIEAAAIVFKEKGYDRATLQDIATRVGITKATLYHHYKNKHELLYTIIHSLMEKGITELSKIVEMPISATQKIHLAFREHFSSYESSFPNYGVLLHENTDSLPRELEQKAKKAFKIYLSLWEKLIKEGIETGSFDNKLDPKITVQAAIGMSNWVYKWASPEGRLKFSQISDMFEDIFTNGILFKQK
jgi:AcrR family transcriptional regulator